MPRKVMSGATIAALCLSSATPALAQEHRFSGFDPPRGMTATVNVRIPLGSRSSASAERPSLGLTVGYGRELPSSEPDGRGAARQVGLLDLRLDQAGIQRARLAGVDLGQAGGYRLPINPEEQGKKGTVVYFFAFLLAVAAGIILLDESDKGQGGVRQPPYTPPSDG